MQDRYVGDVGDFGKYGLLRALGEGKRLGVAWYLHPAAGPVGDGRHTDYLHRCEEFQHLDGQLFDVMKKLVDSGDRSTKAVEQSGVLGDAVFAEDCLDLSNIRVRDRKTWRDNWFSNARAALAGCDLVFADPDNGLHPDDRFKPTRKESAKRMPLSEATALTEGKTGVIYHHNSRRPGGHRSEIRWWMAQLPGCSHAYYWRRWSSRTFFILNPDKGIRTRLRLFAERWKECGELFT